MTQRQIDERKPYSHRELYTPREMEKGDIKQTVGLVVGIASIVGLFYLYRTWVMEDYIETTAVFVDIDRSQKRFEFRLENGDKKVSWANCKHKLEIGDTVWIKYSSFDENVIEVIDKDYKKHMNKNAHNTK